ncbi:MAG TPA: hypothetical protein VGX03_13845 [Candidatus Binatia bacterium]|jgi:hypothetical protein|nr:hypothetical protein [Candidatus Binatia bacterium]
MLKRRRSAAIFALLFGAFYFLTEGLAVLFHGGKPYVKLLKHVDLHLPIHWFFWLSETLGLYRPVESMHWGQSALRAVALGTLIYIALGYLLGFSISPSVFHKPLTSTPAGGG